MINDILSNIDAVLIGSTPAVKMYLGSTVIWENPTTDDEYNNRSYRH
jgi:hypothetical protein